MKQIPMFLDYFNSPHELANFMRKNRNDRYPNMNPYYSGERFLITEYDFKSLVEGENKTIDMFYDSVMALNQISSNWKREYNVCGGRIDMGKAMTGHPKAFVSQVKRNVKNRQINLLVDMTVPYDVSNGTIAMVGSKILASIEKLSIEGNHLGLYAMTSGTWGHTANVMIVKVKSMGEPMELMRIAYPLSNPNFLRRFFFEWHTTDKRIYELNCLGCYLNHNFSVERVSKALSYELGEKFLYVPFQRYIDWENYDFMRFYDDLVHQIDIIDKIVAF